MNTDASHSPLCRTSVRRCCRRVDRAQGGRQRFSIARAGEVEAVVHQVDDAGLQRRRGNDRSRRSSPFSPFGHRDDVEEDDEVLR